MPFSNNDRNANGGVSMEAFLASLAIGASLPFTRTPDQGFPTVRTIAVLHEGFLDLRIFCSRLKYQLITPRH